MTDGLPRLSEVVERDGLRAKRSLGQHFLFDLNLTAKIARAAGALDGVIVVEVGPGPGGLTRALLATGADHVLAIERDARFRPALDEIGAAYPGRLTVMEADALTVDLAAALPGRRIKVVSNLPYNVGTALLVGWLDAPWPPPWESLTLMFQREVAERIVATPESGKTYGRLSVLAGWRTRATTLFDVPPSAFTPPPKVTSTVIHLEPRPDPEACDPRLLSRLTLAAFGQRRKMLRQSLKSVTTDPVALLDAAGIDPRLRAEDIHVSGFVALARALALSR